MKGRRSDSAAYTNDGSEILDMGRIPEWSEDTRDETARFEDGKAVGRSPDGLKDKGYRTRVGIRVRDGERNPFRKIVVEHDDNELTRFSRSGFVGRNNPYWEYFILHSFFGNDSVHIPSPADVTFPLSASGLSRPPPRISRNLFNPLSMLTYISSSVPATVPNLITIGGGSDPKNRLKKPYFSGTLTDATDSIGTDISSSSSVFCFDPAIFTIDENQFA
jgi:hypothetical protein